MTRSPRQRTYPKDECFQEYVGDFWRVADDMALRPGALVWAFVPHTQHEPWRLTAVGRDNPTDHTAATYKIETLRIRAPIAKPQLPVAALPQYPNETLVVSRAKCRPCIVLTVGGAEVEKSLTLGSHPKWQTAPAITVAPFYGADTTAQRAGWNKGLVDRIRAGEYPQYLWDKLPIDNGSSDVSILRLDHLQPVGRHGNSYEATGFQLTDDAMALLEEWITWHRTEKLASSGNLNEIRTLLLSR